ncbi:MAG: hypothetical protein SNJ58_03555 [Aggregatilineales bacterium]
MVEICGEWSIKWGKAAAFFSTFQSLFSSLYETLSPLAKQVALDAAQYTEKIMRADASYTI